MKAEPFINAFGQVLNPGDKVLVVSHCTGYTHTSIGEFAGISDSGNPQVRVPIVTHKYVHNETGETTWNPYWTNTKHLKWNTPEYREAKAVVDQLWTYTAFTGTRVTTLPKKRVYKLAA